MRKQRAPDLTQEVLHSVLDSLDGWSGKLTWDLLLEEVERLTGHRYSRFTFADYPQIADAFSLKKEVLRGRAAEPPSTPRDERVRTALEQAARYKAKCLRLEQENQLLLEQFVTWAINAERKGVTMSMLNAPLPKPHRGQSKVCVR